MNYEDFKNMSVGELEYLNATNPKVYKELALGERRSYFKKTFDTLSAGEREELKSSDPTYYRTLEEKSFRKKLNSGLATDGEKARALAEYPALYKGWVLEANRQRVIRELEAGVLIALEDVQYIHKKSSEHKFLNIAIQHDSREHLELCNKDALIFAFETKEPLRENAIKLCVEIRPDLIIYTKWSDAEIIAKESISPWTFANMHHMHEVSNGVRHHFYNKAVKAIEDSFAGNYADADAFESLRRYFTPNLMSKMQQYHPKLLSDILDKPTLVVESTMSRWQHLFICSKSAVFPFMDKLYEKVEIKTRNYVHKLEFQDYLFQVGKDNLIVQLQVGSNKHIYAAACANERKLDNCDREMLQYIIDCDNPEEVKVMAEQRLLALEITPDNKPNSKFKL